MLQHTPRLLSRDGFTAARPGLARGLAPPRVRGRRALRCEAASTSKSVVVVGGGFAGFGAAKALTDAGYSVTLLDAQPNPGGLSSGFRTKKGQAVEAGMKGFWYSYRNIFSLIEELNLPQWPLTDYTTSGFWGSTGKLTTEAPVFSKLPRLPTLLGQFIHTAPLYWSLSLPDRLSLLPFLATFADYNSSEETFKKYDAMSAYDLFKACGVSKAAYEQFLRPTLLVGLFSTPERLSAGVVLETLYYYALAHQNDFDVCWCTGSVAEKVFTPLVELIRSKGGKVLGNQLVSGLSTEEIDGVEQVTAVEATDRQTGNTTLYQCDAVVFAVGINAMQKLVVANPVLAARNEFQRVMNLQSLDVIATRLFFDRIVPTRFPANVLSGFEPSAGATFFNLNDLQDEYKDASGTVITMDFYNASALLPLPDDALVARCQAHLAKVDPLFKEAKVVDSVVLRYAKAVTHFSPGSYADRPFQTTSLPNCFLAGDWIKGLNHGANGLSQERAYVTGLSAANLVMQRLGEGTPARILDVEPDEPHIKFARDAMKQLREVEESTGLRLPFM